MFTFCYYLRLLLFPQLLASTSCMEIISNINGTAQSSPADSGSGSLSHVPVCCLYDWTEHRPNKESANIA